LNILYMKPEGERPPVVNTSADRDEGIDAVLKAIELVRSRSTMDRTEKYRRRIAEEIRSSALSILKRKVDQHLEQMVDMVLTCATTPIEAAEDILRHLRG